MPANMQNQMPHFVEVELQKQVWTRGQALLGPREALWVRVSQQEGP